MRIVSLSFFRFDTGFDRLWAFGMMGLARLYMPQIEGIGFWKLCGSGTGEGFTPVPNTAVYAILATWPDIETARAQTGGAQIYQRYHKRAGESWTLFLQPTSARGAWAGVAPFEPDGTLGDGPFAALTRATVKPGVAMRFWRQVPDISAVIGEDRNVAFKIGIGEVPLLHQITFSIWPDKATMTEFARAGGPHSKAIDAARKGKWFREELYARFRILGDHGSWGGDSPIRHLDIAS